MTSQNYLAICLLLFYLIVPLFAIAVPPPLAARPAAAPTPFCYYKAERKLKCLSSYTSATAVKLQCMFYTLNQKYHLSSAFQKCVLDNPLFFTISHTKSASTLPLLRHDVTQNYDGLNMIRWDLQSRDNVKNLESVSAVQRTSQHSDGMTSGGKKTGEKTGKENCKEAKSAEMKNYTDINVLLNTKNDPCTVFIGSANESGENKTGSKNPVAPFPLERCLRTTLKSGCAPITTHGSEAEQEFGECLELVSSECDAIVEGPTGTIDVKKQKGMNSSTMNRQKVNT